MENHCFGGGSQPWPEMEGVERRCTIAMARSQVFWKERDEKLKRENKNS
jgi:hypothetical protein